MLTVWLAATVASAQPLLPSDSVHAITTRAVERAMLSDSSAALLRQCAATGAPVARSAVLEAVRRDVCAKTRGAGCRLPDAQETMVPFDSTRARTVAYWPDSLEAVGLLTPADVRALEGLAGPVLDALRSLPASASLPQFDLVAPVLAARERLDPFWLVADVERWRRHNLVTTDGGQSVLWAALDGKLRTPTDVLAHLDAFVVTDVRQTGTYGPGAGGSDQVALFRAGADLLRRREVLNLEVGDVSLDSVRVRSHNPYETSPDHVWREGTAARLTATIDGQSLAQRATSTSAAVDMLNRILRDRRARERVSMALVLPDTLVLDDPGARIALGVLSPEQRAALGGVDPERWESERQALLSTLREILSADSGCAEIARRSFHLFEFDTRLQGPVASEADSTLTTAAVGRMLNALEDVGLLDHLEPTERSDLRRSLSERYFTEPRDVLEAVPYLVVAFDGENAYAPAPYAGLLQRFAEVSRGAFAPTNLEDGFRYDADSVRVAFVEGGQRFEGWLRVQSDWLDYEFLELVLEATDGPGAFYRLGRFSESGFAYLTPEQRRVLEDVGLIPTETVRFTLAMIE